MIEGRGVQKTIQTATIAVVLSILPSTAAACGGCMFSIFEYALPHTLAWCLGITIWFWIVMTIADWYRFFTAILWIVAVFFIGAAFLGPLPFGLLGLMAFATTTKMFRPETWKQFSKQKQIVLKTVSVAAVFCVAVGLIVSMHTKNTRSDVDFILLQGGGHQTRRILKQLIAEKNTVQLRQILAQTENEYLADEVAQALATLEKNRVEQAEEMP